MVSKSKISASDWHVYRVAPFVTPVTNDRRCHGGRHYHEVRRTRSGWETRIRESNGDHVAYGPVESIDDETGERYFALAEQMA